MKQKKKVLANQTVEFSSDGGAVTVKMSCDMKPQSITIASALIEEGHVKKVEDAVLDAFKGVLNRAQDETAKEMKSLAAGLNLPF